MRSYALLSMVGLASAVAPVISIKEAGPAPSGPVVQTITVGGLNANPTGQPTPNLVFSPNSVAAKPGDTIRFMVMASDHNVVQTTFDAPCSPMAGGFVSGPLSNPANTMPGPTKDFVVRDTNPTWFTSSVNNACGQGMVFAVNAPLGSGRGVSDFQAGALKQVGGGFLRNAALQVENPVPQVASTVSINVGQGLAAAATSGAGAGAGGGAGASQPPAGSPGQPMAGQPSVVAGQGMTGGGQTCGCSCLCGQGSFPSNAGQGEFGGFLGTMPAMGAMSPASAGVMPPAGAQPTGGSFVQ